MSDVLSSPVGSKVSGYPCEVSLVEKFTGFNKYSDGTHDGGTFGASVSGVNHILAYRADVYLKTSDEPKPFVEILIYDYLGYVKKHYFKTRNGVVRLSDFQNWLRG